MNNNAWLLKKQWHSLLNEVCTQRLNRRRLREIVDLILYDGEDLQQNQLSNVPSDSVEPALTPVERLLMFVRFAVARSTYTKVPSTNSNGANHSDQQSAQFWQYGNLKQLVHLARIESSPRALSEVEHALLYAQWSSLGDQWARLHPNFRIRQARYEISRIQLDRLENQLSELPTDLGVRSLQALSTYRRGIQTLRRRPRNEQASAYYLQNLLLLPRTTIPVGLYFHAARGIYRLPDKFQREILQKCRLAIASAFALMPQFRFLDRVGICYLIALDALLCDAPEIADKFLAASDDIAMAQEEIPERSIKQMNWLRDQLRQKLELAESVEPTGDDATSVIASLAEQTRSLVESDLSEAYQWLSTRSDNETFVSTLYKDVCQSWIGRLVDGGRPVVASPSFLSTADKVLDQYRNQPRMLALIRAGYVSRLLCARGQEQIDAVFEEHEALLAVSVLSADWEALVDQMARAGHRVFLRKVGFDYETNKLDELAEYFATIFGVTAADAEIRDSPVALDDLLFGTQPQLADLRYGIDAIEARWKTKSILSETDQITVPKWAETYAVSSRFSDFNPSSSDPFVQQFFSDCQTIIECESLLPTLKGLDEIPILAGMAWAAYHFCHILRIVQKDKTEKILTAQDMTDRDWLAKGIEWTDRALALSEKRGRISSLYRLIDVRKRLEKKRTKKKDWRLIEEMSNRMLNIDANRLETTHRPSRKNRAIIRTERSLCEVMDSRFCSSYRTAVALNADSILARRFNLLQQLKSFNYGQLVAGNSTNVDVDPVQETFADQLIDYTRSPDIFDRFDGSWNVMDETGRKKLYEHLLKHRAAILEFVTNPGSGSPEWETEIQQGWGTVCFVIKAGPNGLLIRPIFLEVPETLIRLVVDGAATSEDGDYYAGLQSDLVYWPDDRRGGECPTILQELSDRLFPDILLNEIQYCKRVYLCPHRHLFQVPLHALPLHRPLFYSHETSYALKTAHIIQLASAQPDSITRSPRWMLVDESSLDTSAAWLRSGVNEWGRPGLGVEDLIRQGAGANQAVVCCHGQLDEARPGRARLRLWGGGRLLADDIHRVARLTNGDERRVNLHGSHWVLAACEAGRARVKLRTVPGLALSLVTCGADRVTSCLFRVRPHVANKFLSLFLQATDRGSTAPFTATIRKLYARGGRAAWAEAASFVSYGLLQDGQPAVQTN